MVNLLDLVDLVDLVVGGGSNRALVWDLKAKVISLVRDYAWWCWIAIRILGNLVPNFVIHSVKVGEHISVWILIVYIK